MIYDLLYDKKLIFRSLLISLIAFFLLGLPTALIPNPVFIRMVPAHWFDYVFLLINSMFLGFYFGLSTLKTTSKKSDSQALGGGFISFLAIACPVCNKLLLLLFGSSWLLRYFDPIRPLMGLLSVIILVIAIRANLMGKTCRLPVK